MAQKNIEVSVEICDICGERTNLEKGYPVMYMDVKGKEKVFCDSCVEQICFSHLNNSLQNHHHSEIGDACKDIVMKNIFEYTDTKTGKVMDSKEAESIVKKGLDSVYAEGVNDDLFEEEGEIATIALTKEEKDAFSIDVKKAQEKIKQAEDKYESLKTDCECEKCDKCEESENAYLEAVKINEQIVECLNKKYGKPYLGLKGVIDYGLDQRYLKMADANTLYRFLW